jgi:hypothetical protein
MVFIKIPYENKNSRYQYQSRKYIDVLNPAIAVTKTRNASDAGSEH